MVKEEELSSMIKTPTGAGIVVNTIANASSSPAQTILGVLAKINQISKKVANVRHPSFYEDQLLMFTSSSLCKCCVDCFECSTQCPEISFDVSKTITDDTLDYSKSDET